ncbi:unnamed protein product [Miscanthus lutarioriparius]|uniref:Uncharacterized protein n=1 Tax=Miscanthus lutarioriparius TaxID=422564 RepID=A0A811S575_9POAL|nr:unnamed protein product [Miscanthus lutarioriparius]
MAGLFIAGRKAVRGGKIFRPGGFLPATAAGHSEDGDPSHRKSAVSCRRRAPRARGGRGGDAERTRRQRQGGGWSAAAATRAQRVSDGGDVLTVPPVGPTRR